jgi:hypothetical protein
MEQDHCVKTLFLLQQLMSLENALSIFIEFIQQTCSINSCGTQSISVLIGHNAAVFDVPVLLGNSWKSYDEQLDQINVNSNDSLPLIKSFNSKLACSSEFVKWRLLLCKYK